MLPTSALVEVSVMEEAGLACARVSRWKRCSADKRAEL